ncbi:hypothetical protein AFCDBAGC_3325 [Methylobacterium cerastii]|uniref:DUF2852 domain-containing protein n=1 Tax=Methylobacterium cerastii TaxID=932741 RepID=A0ABQ4QJW7_9HYPH|nr:MULTISPECIES: DUF2852 domain-containing protein [Methylobacterium]TXN07183.1 DUF2852 domain-containing protein [Methylobacterium sp. WL122]TXM69927.1 DUF2852 domain-containing protein [Methylobacterium sp. WL12]TXM97625.1 DUF2852 domain-containing protein [Methylobacterium sp. WL103]TXN84639.1 DUF2852 domain-containing protein [Methylobacterium sp. WL8]GJD45452.1 hypothetical protein AFCDBAGC_3325 [Methylobacterium cerastii]
MSTSSSSPWTGGKVSRCGPFPRRSIEIGAIVVSFIYWWPVGLALVAWKVAGYPALGELRDYAKRGAAGWEGGTARASRFARSFDASNRRGATGNWAFEEYRKAELDRLDAQRRALQEESRAFAEFVEELKRAKDRDQFDAFMAKRRADGEGKTFNA